jgi:purine-cytosine permease-like protein
MRSYQRFLLLLGAVFVPLLGVLVAHWLLNGAHYTRRDVFEGPLVRPGSIVAWVAGFLVYEWLYQPADLGFWSDLLAKLPTPEYQIGASLPSFTVAFVLTGVFQTLSSPRATVTAEPPTSTR